MDHWPGGMDTSILTNSVKKSFVRVVWFIYRSGRPEILYKKIICEVFRKYLFQSLFLNKVTDFWKSTCFKDHLRVTTSGYNRLVLK